MEKSATIRVYDSNSDILVYLYTETDGSLENMAENLRKFFGHYTLESALKYRDICNSHTSIKDEVIMSDLGYVTMHILAKIQSFARVTCITSSIASYKKLDYRYQIYADDCTQEIMLCIDRCDTIPHRIYDQPLRNFNLKNFSYLNEE